MIKVRQNGCVLLCKSLSVSLDLEHEEERGCGSEEEAED